MYTAYIKMVFITFCHVGKAIRTVQSTVFTMKWRIILNEIALLTESHILSCVVLCYVGTVVGQITP